MPKLIKNGIFSNNTLKIIAAIAMVCDHVGVLIFPKLLFLRIIGRLAFPIFAYLIAEGAKHTRSKKRHLIVFASFAAIVQVIYFVIMPPVSGRQPEMSVLVTFTLSLVMIYALDELKKAIFDPFVSKKKTVLTALLFAGSIALTVLCDRFLDLDYGLSGALLPLFPAIFTTPQTENPPSIFKTVDTKPVRVLSTAIGVLALSLDFGSIQFYSLLSIPLLLLYSEKRGKLKMKYFFYIFYPLHLAIIFGIAVLIRLMR